MYTSDDDRNDHGYSLTLGNGLSWRFSADPACRDWLKSFAAVLGLSRGNEGVGLLHFMSRRSQWSWPRHSKRSFNGVSRTEATSSDWQYRDFPRLRLWYQVDSPHAICEIKLPKNRADAILRMFYAVQAIYHGLVLKGGFPLHSALVEKNQIGVLLVGNEGVGKSTCCRRLPDSWNVIADDSVVISPGPNLTFFAHPFPTWSELLNCGQNITWNVQKPVRLGVVVFLGRSEKMEIMPLGQGRAAAMMAASASYVCNIGHQKSDRFAHVELRKRLFLNACSPAASVQSFSLKLGLEGAFWEKIQEAIEGYPMPQS